MTSGSLSWSSLADGNGKRSQYGDSAGAKSFARHMGHVLDDSNHVIKQDLWKICRHMLIFVAGSMSEYASRQIEQLSSCAVRHAVRICLRPKLVKAERDE